MFYSSSVLTLLVTFLMFRNKRVLIMGVYIYYYSSQLDEGA